jgi:DNA-binding transcriptional regulator YiaG
MQFKRWVEDLKGIGGLNYILFKNVPMRESKRGPIIEFNETLLEETAARAIIEHRIPIRGQEVKFLRKVLGLSMEVFSEQLGLTASAVFKWEHKAEDRLHPINEIAVRSLVADHLGIEIAGRFSKLVAQNQFPSELVLQLDPKEPESSLISLT